MSETEQPIAFGISTDAWVARQQLPAETSQISYHSAGHTLFVCSASNGGIDDALNHLESFREHGVTVVAIDPSAQSIDKQLLDTGTAVFTVPSLVLNGHLGAFHAIAVDATRELDLAVAVFRESGAFDVVLDCGSAPSIDVTLKPFGYAYCAEGRGITDAIESLSGFVGEFDKPKYFDYDVSVCAHSRSELKGCSRCIDVCATGAIRHDGEGVKVDPYLCQGCGSCATVCPSGAMSYAFPRPSDAIARSRELLAGTNANTNTLFLYSEKQQASVDALSDDPNFSDSVQLLLVEEVTAYGLDYWLSLLAGYVQRIIVLVSSDETDVTRSSGSESQGEVEIEALRFQQSVLHALLGGLGVTASALHLLPEAYASEWSNLPAADPLLAKIPPTNHSTHNNKRQTVRLALDAMADALMPNLSTPITKTELPAGSPFGRINVDTDACTLCMACVSTCPAKALQDGQDTPALKFIESNCVQCGLCTEACPESALSLQPQYLWDSTAARQVEMLNEDEPFHCIQCHTPFATAGVISSMTMRLGDHWMFQDDKAIRRLKMCGDCRVKDIFRENAAGIETHKETS